MSGEVNTVLVHHDISHLAGAPVHDLEPGARVVDERLLALSVVVESFEALLNQPRRGRSGHRPFAGQLSGDCCTTTVERTPEGRNVAASQPVDCPRKREIRWFNLFDIGPHQYHLDFSERGDRACLCHTLEIPVTPIACSVHARKYILQ